MADTCRPCRRHLESPDERAPGEAREHTFVATLTRPQQEAVKDLRDHDQGVLVAPPGAGKDRHRLCADCRARDLDAGAGRPQALTDQWRTRIYDLFGVKAGQLGGGHRKTHGVVDIAMLQTLARKNNIEELVGQYGLVVVLGSSLAKRASGYVSLGFPDPRRARG